MGRLSSRGRASAVAALALTLLCGATAAEEPRYIVVNIAANAGRVRTESKADFAAQLAQVRDAVGGTGTPETRLGVSYIFSLLAAPAEELAARLRDLLAASKETGVPVLVTFDGQNWWEDRPDLWNWWDPNRPGYNPENVRNVEWTDWTPASAVKIGWRDWGSQLRVAPAQNIASPKVIEANLAPLRTLLPILVEWQRALPENRKHLFIGVKLGWEAGIGYNAFYYPDGNRFQEQWPDDSSHDPRTGIDMKKGLNSGAVQLGYAAVKTLGIKDSGPITRDDIGRVTQHYLETLAKTAHDAGLPHDKVYVHQGGTGAPYDQHLPYSAAFNEWSCPGWSVYWQGPATAGPVGAEMDAAGITRWAAAEWLWPGQDAAWEDHLRQTLGFRDCRFVCIYNWEGIVDQHGAVEGIRRALARGEWRVMDVAAGPEFLSASEAEKSGLVLEPVPESDSDPRLSACTVVNAKGGERAVTLAYCIPLDASGWTWWDNPERRRAIEGDAIYGNIVEEFFTYQYKGSQYPLAVVSNEERGLCLAVPLQPARIPRFVYDAARKELRAEFDFGLSPVPERFPSRADASVLVYDVPPTWAFRRALERYYALYPDAFRRHAGTGGTFLTKSPIDAIERPEDFGFAWHDFETRVAAFAEADERLGVRSFIYREPQTNWRALRENTERTYDNFVAQLREDAANGDRKAQGTLVSGVERADGRMDLYLEPIAWATSAPFGTNADPALPSGTPGWPSKGQYELEDLGRALGWDGSPSRFDGVFYDSMEGWANLLNYRKEHWRTARHPLTFDRGNGNRVCLSNLWGNYAFAEALSKGLRDHNQLMMGNGAFHFLWVYAPFVDIPGREYSWYTNGAWTPVPDERFLFLRSMAYRRPCWLLMNDPFDDASHLEEYFQRCLFYAAFPSMFHAHTGTSYAYFAQPNYYERDRHLFVKYVPLVRRLDDAGWQPVPYATADPADARIERYGDFAARNLAFAVHNPTPEQRDITLRLSRESLALPETFTAREWLADRPVAIADSGATLRLTLPPNAYAVVSLEN